MILTIYVAVKVKLGSIVFESSVNIIEIISDVIRSY